MAASSSTSRRPWREVPVFVERRAAPAPVRAVGGALLWLVTWWLALMADLVAIPARAWSALTRRDAISRMPRRAPSTWRHTIADPCPPKSTWGTTPLDSVHTRPRRLTLGRVAAVVAVLLILDVTFGSAFSAIRGGPERAPGRLASVAPTERTRRTIDVEPQDNPVADAPALADVPWAHAFFRELSTVVSYDQPFVLFDETDHTGTYLNIHDGIRDSYEPAGAEDAPVVWFFGASTVLGWAQRDDHTIASEVARLAEADGQPVRVVNFGVPGYVSMQEALRFEREIATYGPPDMVVFYDGSNDIAAQALQPPTDDPTLLDDPLNLGLRMQGVLPDSDPLFDRKELSELLRRSSPGEEEGPAVRRAMALYGRSIAIARDLAREKGVDMHVFFQPQNTTASRVELARKSLPAGVIDISGSLDGAGQDTYIDAVHTNERGARIVAEAMYPYLAPDIARLTAETQTSP